MKKIVVLGPESTGKSFLCEQLAAHYKAPWVAEYAREYLKNRAGYRYEDLYEIAIGQMRSEDWAVDSGPLNVESNDELHELTPINETSNLEPSTFNLEPSTRNLQPSSGNLKPLFLDTDLYTIRIWSEISFNRCDNRILTQIAKRSYDLYLLCNTDLPWAPDPLREYPDLRSRQKIYNYYKDALVNQEMPWVDISGGYEERFLKARTAVDELV